MELSLVSKKPLILLVFYAYFALFDIFLRKIEVLIISLFLCVFAVFFLVFISCCVKVQCRFLALTKTRKMHYNEIFAAVLHFLNDLRGIEFKVHSSLHVYRPSPHIFDESVHKNTKKPDCTCPRLSRFEKLALVLC